jgi:dienelactone hydrolase
VADVVLFHSVRGLRPAEHAWADRMRGAGHAVTLPDLFAGETSQTIDDGLAIQERVGWATMMARARAAVTPLPPETVLAGVSVGAQVAGELWADRPAAAGLLLLHGPCEVPASPRRGLPVQAHLAEPEPFDDEEFIAGWAEGMRAAELAFELFRYPGAGHYFTDPALPDYREAAARLASERAIAFLAGL